MEKIKIKNLTVKKVAFCNDNPQIFLLENNTSEIRLGISAADEKAKKELKKRRMEAPPSIEELILTNK